jgi:hypothetical protein
VDEIGATFMLRLPQLWSDTAQRGFYIHPYTLPSLPIVTYPTLAAVMRTHKLLTTSCLKLNNRASVFHRSGGWEIHGCGTSCFGLWRGFVSQFMDGAFCFWCWGLNSGPWTYWAGALLLEPLRQPFLLYFFFFLDRVLCFC